MVVYKKLSLDDENKTKIMAGQTAFSVQQLEDEMKKGDSDIAKKLKSIEHELDNY